jgi:hypothetical protein
MSTEGASRTYVLDGLTITGSAQCGIYLRRNTCDIRHCIITGNQTGIAGNNATLSIEDSVLTYNGLGLDMSFSGVAINKSMFCFNEDIGVKMSSSGFFMVNSVVSENQMNGISFVTPSTTEILNSNIINNTGYGLYGISGGVTTKINNNVVYGNYSNAIPAGQYINNNVQNNPPFWFPYIQDSDYVKYQLSPDSNTCIDTGNTMLVGYYPLDLYGQARVVDSVVDVGAVESKPISANDYNLDGTVNFIDYAEFAAVWCTDVNDLNYDVKYDLNTDGYINVDDLSLLTSNWLYGAMPAGTITSTYKIDFGYRVPETGMMMMSLPDLVYEPAYSFILDGTPFDIIEAPEFEQGFALEDSICFYSDAKIDDMPIEQKFELAKDRLVTSNSELSSNEADFFHIVPRINLINKQRQQNLDMLMILQWLDDIWLSGELGDSMTENDYFELRNGIEDILNFDSM